MYCTYATVCMCAEEVATYLPTYLHMYCRRLLYFTFYIAFFRCKITYDVFAEGNQK